MNSWNYFGHISDPSLTIPEHIKNNFQQPLLIHTKAVDSNKYHAQNFLGYTDYAVTIICVKKLRLHVFLYDKGMSNATGGLGCTMSKQIKISCNQM